jgi:glycosyltransferase involved in cell wall biosynthesis
MNILHIATTLARGGAANSLRLLHRALREAGHGSRVLTGRPSAPQEDVEALPPMPVWARVPYHGLNLMGLNYAGIPTTGRIAAHPWFAWADVVHYHNLHGGYFNYLALPKLTARKPSVWTLRDMWGLTGHCAYSLECDRWRTGCGRCPHPELDPPIRRDATRLEWKLKRNVYGRSKMLVTAPSRWLAELARESMLGQRPVRQVHNAVDTERYRPRDKAELRGELGWPVDATVLLFAADALDNPFKHYGLLLSALRGLPETRRSRLVLAVLGEGEDAAIEGIRTLPLGLHDDDESIARIYAAADLFVFPTRADNQPRVLIEAMACGCPCVATDVGGVSELVVHGETGWLARAGDADELRKGIEALAGDPAARARMGANGRRLAVERHGVTRHAADFLAVYEEAIHLWLAPGEGT